MVSAELTWSDWPARRQRLRAILAAVALGVASLAAIAFEPILGAVLSAALLASCAEVLLPTRYRLGPDGVILSRVLGRRRQPWSDFKGWRPLPDGFWLEGAGRIPLLVRRRSLAMRCPEHRAAVEAVLRAHIGAVHPGEGP